MDISEIKDGDYIVQEFKFKDKPAKVIFRFYAHKQCPMLNAVGKFIHTYKNKSDSDLGASTNNEVRRATSLEIKWLDACILADKAVPEPREATIVDNYSIF